MDSSGDDESALVIFDGNKALHDDPLLRLISKYDTYMTAAKPRIATETGRFLNKLPIHASREKEKEEADPRSNNEGKSACVVVSRLLLDRGGRGKDDGSCHPKLAVVRPV